MPLSMEHRKAVTREMHRAYRKASKKEKGAILDHFVELTGHNRAYAARILLATPKERPRKQATRKRPRVYGPEVLLPLRKIWATLDTACGKRIAPALPEMCEVMERFGELSLSDGVRAKLHSISAATIDRLLAPDRASVTLHGRAMTKPGTLLKSQIPIRTWADWDDSRPGFVEIDLVGHEGGNPNGDFCQTLDVTCVVTGWTETRAVKNKAQVWVFAALERIAGALPFPVLGIDSDNGSEFINKHLVRYCDANKITFTRSRVGNKNDGCHVEQKNWSVVRRNVGYSRYDTPEELEVLNELYAVLRLHTNFFMPSMTLLSKTREGARVTRCHSAAATPYARVVASDDIDGNAKERLREHYAALNPVALKREIWRLQQRLLELSALKNTTRAKEVEASAFEYISDEATNRPLEHFLR